MPNGVTFIVCLFVLSLAIKYGKIGKLDLGDYLALFFSMVAIVLWLITDNPFY